MPRRLLYCDELRKILGLPVPCGCETFICEHTPPMDLSQGTVTIEDLRIWHAAERHRWKCETCARIRRLELRAMTKPWRDWERRCKLADRQDRPSRGGRP